MGPADVVVPVLVVLIVAVYVQIAQANINARRALAATIEVKETLAANTSQMIAEIHRNYEMEALIHSLVNSRLSEALGKIDRLEQRIFALTGDEPTGEPPPRHVDAGDAPADR